MKAYIGCTERVDNAVLLKKLIGIKSVTLHKFKELIN